MFKTYLKVRRKKNLSDIRRWKVKTKEDGKSKPKNTRYGVNPIKCCKMIVAQKL